MQLYIKVTKENNNDREELTTADYMTTVVYEFTI